MSTDGSVPELLAAWAARRAESPLEGRLEHAFRIRLLDFVANLVGGSTTDPARVLERHTSRFRGAVPALGGVRTCAEAAALAYGATAHALECDDTHQPSSTHPGAVIFSATLPLASELDASLEDIGAAVVAGYEVMCRLGEVAGPAGQYARGFHPTGTCGVFGASVAASILLGSGRDEIAAALGLATSFASGSMAFLAGGGWSKLLNAGHAASAGITVARLARDGYQSPRESIIGPHGFLAGHGDTPDPHSFEWVDAASAIERTSTKAHGCCRYEQGPIDAILALRLQHGFDAEDVAAVRVGMLSAGVPIVAEPRQDKRRPRTVVESQFSMPFGAALALVRGRAAPMDHNEINLADPAIHRAMDVVECHTDPSLDLAYPAKWPATVDVTLRSGARFEERVDYPKGDPENPLSRTELLHKLAALSSGVGDDQLATVAQLTLDDPLGGTKVATLLDAVSAMWAARGSEALAPA